MKPYQYPVTRRKKAKNKAPAIKLKAPEDAEPMGLIQGHTPGSRLEWRVAVALEKFKIPYRYQVPIMGGRLRRGGQIVDFVVDNPFPVAVPVMGEYWHYQRDDEEKLKLAVLEQYFGRPAIPLWENELQTQQEADEAVRRKLL